jgi:RNA polymerase sigma-70 factor (ECF subfamily)
MMANADEAQWIEWYKSLEKPLYNVVYRWLWNAADSQDIVQDAFLRCWRIRHRIEPGGFQALLFRTALRLASNHRRRRRLWQFLPFSASTEHSEDDEIDMLASRKVRAAIDGLPERLKRVLLLSELAGLSHREIAAVMKVKEGTVGSRRSRAIQLLRHRLTVQGVTWDEC